MWTQRQIAKTMLGGAGNCTFHKAPVHGLEGGEVQYRVILSVVKACRRSVFTLSPFQPSTVLAYVFDSQRRGPKCGVKFKLEVQDTNRPMKPFLILGLQTIDQLDTCLDRKDIATRFYFSFFSACRSSRLRDMLYGRIQEDHSLGGPIIWGARKVIIKIPEKFHFSHV